MFPSLTWPNLPDVPVEVAWHNHIPLYLLSLKELYHREPEDERERPSSCSHSQGS